MNYYLHNPLSPRLWKHKTTNYSSITILLCSGAISTSHSLHKREVVSAVQEGQSSTLDPLLVNIFGADLPKTTASSTTVKVPKPKPVFNDGQKLVRFDINDIILT